MSDVSKLQRRAGAVRVLRVLVCGSRDFDDTMIIWRELFDLRRRDPIMIIHGGAPGADTIAADFAEMYGLEVEAYPADWKRYGKRAGYLRNEQMLDEGKPDVVIAFYSSPERSKGTKMMVNLALQSGVRTREVFA